MFENLISKVEKRGMLKKGSFSNESIDVLLDLRDQEEFDSEWMRIFNKIKEKKFDNLIEKEIEQIREKTFISAYDFSNSSDIASCVSDDFEMICRAYIIKLDDEWLNALIMSYANYIFPCGKLKVIKENINDAYNKLLRS